MAKIYISCNTILPGALAQSAASTIPLHWEFTRKAVIPAIAKREKGPPKNLYLPKGVGRHPTCIYYMHCFNTFHISFQACLYTFRHAETRWNTRRFPKVKSYCTVSCQSTKDLGLFCRSKCSPDLWRGRIFLWGRVGLLLLETFFMFCTWLHAPLPHRREWKLNVLIN